MIEEIIILNIKQATVRLNACLNAFKEQGTPTEIITPFHPVLASGELSEFVKDYIIPKYPEYACFVEEPRIEIGHTVAYLEMLQSVVDTGKITLLIEDDQLLGIPFSRLQKWIGTIKEHAAENDRNLFVQLKTWLFGEETNTQPPPKLVKNTPFAIGHQKGCAAVVFSPEAAQSFINAYRQFVKEQQNFAMIDMFMHNDWTPHCGYYYTGWDIIDQNPEATVSSYVNVEGINADAS